MTNATETKKTTKTDLAKISITEIINLTGTKTIPEITKMLETDFGFKTSRDTVSKALAELIDENVIIQKQGNKKGSFEFSAVKIVKKRGWKTALIKKLASQHGATIKRAVLAAVIQSDVRNTHILISCIRKSWDTENVITWDKNTKSYNFS